MGVRTDGAQLAALAPSFSAAWLADAPEQLHRRRTGSLVSADLSGFTAMSERLAALGKEGAERLTGIVNGCFETLISIAAAEGGDVLKFGGDALLIWFEGPDGPQRSARASVRMQRAIGRPKFVKLGLRMSVGAHHGDFDLFLVGEPEWRELVLVGAPVSRTVDLESAAEPGQVLVSKELADQLPDTWRSRRAGGGVLLDLDAVPTPRRAHPEPEPRGDARLVAPALQEEVGALAGLGGEHRIASIVFLEVLGTDQSVARAGPEEFARGVDALVRSAQGLRSGSGVQFLYTDVIADGIKLIATAGAPVSTVNDDEAALRYAVDIVHGDPSRQLKGGVNSGRIFAGFLGSSSRYTYTVMGDPVNLSARLMAHAEPGQVVVSTEVVARSKAQVTSRELPPFLVKGKSKPVTAVVVDGVSEARKRSPRAPSGLPLVGREAELAELREIVGQVAAGHGRAVEILGEAGVGKSRLIAEVATDERLFHQVTVECQPYHANTAYAAAKVVLRRLVGIPYSASDVEAGRLLRRTVSRVRPELLPMLPLLAVPMDAVVASTPEADAIASDFVLARTHEAVLDLLTVMVGTPTLLLVEDAYYADPASAALFSALAGQIADRPWLLFGTSRPDSRLLITGVDDVHRLSLEPLPESSAVELAAAALAGAAEDSDVAAALAAVANRAGGNPLFVLELMQAVRHGVAAEDLPESVERIVAERLDRLNPTDRTLVRYAAVVGARFDTELLDLVLTSTGQSAADPRTWDGLGDLVERDGEHHVRFRHVLYRDVAYEGLPFGRRGRLHQRVGELIEASSRASDVALLAEHFFRAGDHERTWRYSVAAGDRAWDQLAVAESAVAYERALKVRRRVRGLTPRVVARISEALGDVLERTASYEAADKSYRAAGRLLAADALGSARILRKRGVLREHAGKYAGALRWYRRAQSLLASGADPWMDAPVLVASAGVLHRLGRTAEQIEVARTAIDHAVRAGDRDTEAHASLSIQTALTHAGDLENIEYGRRALDLFTDLGNVLFQGKVHNNLGVACYFRGDWTPAAEHYRNAAQHFDAAGDVVEAAVARNNLGEVLSDQGLTTEAIALFERARGAFDRAQYRLGSAVVRSNTARARARGGDPAGAAVELVETLAAFRALDADMYYTEGLLRLAEAHLLAGATSEAAAVLADVEQDIVAGAGFPGSDASLARLHSWRQRQGGHAAEAMESAREAADLAAQDGARYERALAVQQIAELTDDSEARAEAARELAALGVVRLPALPVPL